MNKLVIIESPYALDVEANVQFARLVCRYAIRMNCAPFASHLFYTQFLRDDIPAQRATGIEAGFDWGAHANEVWFCHMNDVHWSNGMIRALAHYKGDGIKCESIIFESDDKGELRPRVREIL